MVDGFIPQVALLTFGAWGSRDAMEVFVQGGMACVELEEQGGLVSWDASISWRRV